MADTVSPCCHSVSLSEGTLVVPCYAAFFLTTNFIHTASLCLLIISHTRLVKVQSCHDLLVRLPSMHAAPLFFLSYAHKDLYRRAWFDLKRLRYSITFECLQRQTEWIEDGKNRWRKKDLASFHWCRAGHSIILSCGGIAGHLFLMSAENSLFLPQLVSIHFPMTSTWRSWKCQKKLHFTQ